MSIVSSGSALGAVIHPIMLNNTLRSPLGFGNAVRASAGLVSGLQLVACVLMRPRLPPSKTQPPFWSSLRRFSADAPYVLASVGWAPPPTYTGSAAEYDYICKPDCRSIPSASTFRFSTCSWTQSHTESTRPSPSTPSVAVLLIPR